MRDFRITHNPTILQAFLQDLKPVLGRYLLATNTSTPLVGNLPVTSAISSSSTVSSVLASATTTPTANKPATSDSIEYKVNLVQLCMFLVSVVVVFNL